MSNKRFAVIILAAGASSRMTAFKPLLVVGSKTITEWLISIYLDMHVDIFLVTGYRSNDLRKFVQNWNITVIENEDYSRGMFSSVQCGAKSLSPQYNAFFVHPVDIPMVRPSTIRRLLDTYNERPDSIIYPVFDGKRGHPPLISYKLKDAIQRQYDNGGLREFLELYNDSAIDVSVPDQFIHRDIDTDDDYGLLVHDYQNYNVPTEKECFYILDRVVVVTQNVRNHSLKVAEVAMTLGKALLDVGKHIDLDVIKAASLLHDIAKGQKKHAAAGMEILIELGFAKIGEIISMHMYIPGDIINVSLEAKVTALADKFVKGDRLVTIEQRFQPSIDKFKKNPGVLAGVLSRKKQAIMIKNEIEALLGYPIKIDMFT